MDSTCIFMSRHQYKTDMTNIMAKTQTGRERQRMSEKVTAGKIEIVSEARPNLMEEGS